jgi:hypothetical protein
VRDFTDPLIYKGRNSIYADVVDGRSEIALLVSLSATTANTRGVYRPPQHWHTSDRPCLGLTQTYRQICTEFLSIYTCVVRVLLAPVHLYEYLDLSIF